MRKKIGQAQGKRYAWIKKRSNYYAFGMLQPGRSYNSSDYRYGFNGKEKDDELKGSGNSYDFGARLYDPRLGRWMAMDPLQAKYPSLSPYNFVANQPIRAIDPDGREIRLIFDCDEARDAYINSVNKSLGGAATISIVTTEDVHGYTNQVVLTYTNMEGPITASQQAFLEEYSAVVNDKDVARHEIVQNDPNTKYGDWGTGRIDMADIAKLDQAGPGGSTSAGALIHETVEQLDKTKQGLGPTDWSATGDDKTKVPPEFYIAHEKAEKAENKVNGNTRGVPGNSNVYVEKDGTKTLQKSTGNSEGGVDVQKMKLK